MVRPGAKIRRPRFNILPPELRAALEKWAVDLVQCFLPEQVIRYYEGGHGFDDGHGAG
jgi:hypothetical protein